MKKLLLAGVGALALTSYVNAQSLPARAVHFDGATRLINPGTLFVTSGTKAGACSYWYNVLDSVPFVIIDTQNETGVLTAAHVPQLESGTMHLYLSISSGISGTGYWHVVSTSILPAGDHKWHHVAFAWDTATQRFTYDVDGVEALPDPDLTVYTASGPMELNMFGTRWSVGSALGPRSAMPPRFFGNQYVGRLLGVYHGDLAEVMCHLGDDVYTRSITPGLSGWVQLEIRQGGIRTAYGPVEMGSNCEAVYDEFPAVCLRGDAGNFYRNQTDIYGPGTAFTVDYGALITAQTDPWILWRQ